MPDRFVKLAREMSEIGRGFYARSWVLGTGGNFSAVGARDPLRVVITGSGVDKGRLSEQHFVLLGDDGRMVGGHTGEPSAESRLHLRIVRSTGAGAVFHTHSTWSTIASDDHSPERGLWVEGYEMLKGLRGVSTHEHSEWIPILENSQDMDELDGRLDAMLDERPVCHGFLVRKYLSSLPVLQAK